MCVATPLLLATLPEQGAHLWCQWGCIVQAVREAGPFTASARSPHGEGRSSSFTPLFLASSSRPICLSSGPCPSFVNSCCLVVPSILAWGVRHDHTLPLPLQQGLATGTRPPESRAASFSRSFPHLHLFGWCCRRRGGEPERGLPNPRAGNLSLPGSACGVAGRSVRHSSSGSPNSRTQGVASSPGGGGGLHTCRGRGLSAVPAPAGAHPARRRDEPWAGRQPPGIELATEGHALFLRPCPSSSSPSRSDGRPAEPAGAVRHRRQVQQGVGRAGGWEGSADGWHPSANTNTCLSIINSAPPV